MAGSVACCGAKFLVLPAAPEGCQRLPEPIKQAEECWQRLKYADATVVIANVARMACTCVASPIEVTGFVVSKI